MEVAASGTPEPIAALRRALLEGPPGARVDELRDLPAGGLGELPYPFTIEK